MYQQSQEETVAVVGREQIEKPQVFAEEVCVLDKNKNRSPFTISPYRRKWC
jgi:hypothetical protein